MFLSLLISSTLAATRTRELCNPEPTATLDQIANAWGLINRNAILHGKPLDTSRYYLQGDAWTPDGLGPAALSVYISFQRGLDQRGAPDPERFNIEVDVVRTVGGTPNEPLVQENYALFQYIHGETIPLVDALRQGYGPVYLSCAAQQQITREAISFLDLLQMN